MNLLLITNQKHFYRFTVFVLSLTSIWRSEYFYGRWHDFYMSSSKQQSWVEKGAALTSFVEIKWRLPNFSDKLKHFSKHEKLEER